MRRALNPTEIEALAAVAQRIGVQTVAADASVGEHTVRRALRGARLNGGSACALVLYLNAWEGARMAA